LKSQILHLGIGWLRVWLIGWLVDGLVVFLDVGGQLDG
jgi:hypothetical protein